MQKLIFLFLFLFSSILESNEEIKTFVQGLSSDQKELLDAFFRILIKDSLSGYVLYGDKPMCTEAHGLSLGTGAMDGFDDKQTILMKGVKLWEDFNITPSDKNYFFLIFNAHGHRHFVCINRAAFTQAVNDNLPLFRYVLGPFLTAESLLNELILKKDEFYHVLKKDNVLLGILLGYGTENALLCSRLEYITDSFSADHVEDFPLISRKDRMQQHTLPNTQLKRPSMGFLSLADEIDLLNKSKVISRMLSPFESYKIPYFACQPASEETQQLISLYKMNRDEIIKAFESDTFLEQTLYKFFSTTSHTLDIPKIPSPTYPVSPQNQEAIFAERVRQELRQEKYFQESYYADFMNGISSRENNQEIAENLKKPFNQIMEQYFLEKDLERSENLQKSTAYFKTLASQGNLIPLMPNKLYYKITNEGNGSPSPSKVKTVSLNFTYSILGEPEIYPGSINNEKVEYFIPGIALALIGMKQGEQREVYIHPEYGCGEDSYLPPNTTLIAKIELVDFHEGNQEVAFSPIKNLNEQNYDDLYHDSFIKLEALNKERFFKNGFDFWDHYKKTMDYQIFQKNFNESKD